MKKLVVKQIFRQPFRTLVLIVLLATVFSYTSFQCFNVINAIQTKNNIIKNHPVVGFMKETSEISSDRKINLYDKSVYLTKEEIDSLNAIPFVKKVNILDVELGYSSIASIERESSYQGYSLERIVILDATIESVIQSDRIFNVYYIIFKIDQFQYGNMFTDNLLLTSLENNKELPSKPREYQVNDRYAVEFQNRIPFDEEDKKDFENWIYKLKPNAKITMVLTNNLTAQNVYSIVGLSQDLNIFLDESFKENDPLFGVKNMFIDSNYSLGESILFHDTNEEDILNTVDMINDAVSFKQHSYPVMFIDDNKAVYNFAKGTAKIIEGIGINEDNYDKNVCLISDVLSRERDLTVGDTIDLTLYEGMMDRMSKENFGPFYSYDSKDTAKVTNSTEFEIVGIYSDKNKEYRDDPYFIDRTTIFVPKSYYPVDFNKEKSIYTNQISFILEDPSDKEAFMDYVKGNTQFMNFEFTFMDNEYEQYMQSTLKLLDNSIVSLCLAIFVLIVVVGLITYFNITRRIQIFSIYLLLGYQTKEIIKHILFEISVLIGLSYIVSLILLSLVLPFIPMFILLTMAVLLISILWILLLILMINVTYKKSLLSLVRYSK